jgi:hypothetical protein
MSRRPNRSAVLVERGPKERQHLGLPPRQRPEPPRPTGPTRRGDGTVRELMDPSREATAALSSPSLRSSRSALSPTRDRESIRGEFEAREAAGGRPSKRPAEASEPPRQRRPIMRAPNAVVKDLISKSCSAETAGGRL